VADTDQPGDPWAAELAREVVAIVRAAGLEPSYDPGRFAVGYFTRPPAPRSRVVGFQLPPPRPAPDGRIELGDLYQRLAGLEPAERSRRLRREVLALIGVPDTAGDRSGALPRPGMAGTGGARAEAIPLLRGDWAGTLPQLRPGLRPVSFALRESARPALASRPALPHLREYVVLDAPLARAFVTTETLDSWGVSTGQALQAARANLAEIAPWPPDGLPAVGGGVIRLIEDGSSYVTSLPVLDGWLAGCAGALGARPVLFMPDEEAVILMRDDPGQVALALERMEVTYRNSGQAISPQAYTVDDDGTVTDYPAPPGHPLHRQVHRAGVLLAAHQYQAQNPLLQAEAGDEVYVAPPMVLALKDGRTVSVTVWGPDLHYLLPEADYVGFTSSGGTTFNVPWQHVADETGLTPEEGLLPARYRVRDWPDGATIARLRARASPL
jgi:hypothetical protein